MYYESMMKKLLILLAVFSSSYALAVSDLKAAIASTKVLIAAINADATRLYFTDMQYVPDYGLVTLAQNSDGVGSDSRAIVNTIKTLTLALAPTLKGLDASDWLNFNIRFGYDTSVSYLTVRVKYGEITSKNAVWETWINGKKQ